VLRQLLLLLQHKWVPLLLLLIMLVTESCRYSKLHGVGPLLLQPCQQAMALQQPLHGISRQPLDVIQQPKHMLLLLLLHHC
jgi:hypothetical protein